MEYDDFDQFISPEELQCDNPIDEDFEPSGFEGEYDREFDYDDRENFELNELQRDIAMGEFL